MRYIIDTDTGTCVPVESEKKTTIDILKPYEGTKEYDGIVGEIQKWYYGAIIKAPWCATCASWVLNKLGRTSCRSENVFTLLLKCKSEAESGSGKFYHKDQIQDLQKGDVCFFLWSGSQMTTTSSKHVSFLVSDRGQFLDCLGGNQSDAIMTSTYERKNLYAIYRP